MWAMSPHASALAMDFSQSFDKRRHRPGQAKMRSTTHRRGITSTPSAGSDRLMATVQRPMAFSASRSFGPAYPPSAKTKTSAAGRARGDGLERIRRAVPILYRRAVDLEPDQQTGRVGDDMAPRRRSPRTGGGQPPHPLIRLPASYPRISGLAVLDSSLAAAHRRHRRDVTRATSALATGRRHVNARQTPRRPVMRGRPLVLGACIKGAISAHSASVTSLALSGARPGNSAS